MSVGTLVRKVSNGAMGIVVKVKSSDHYPGAWCSVLFYDERIVGCWAIELEAV